MRTSFFADTSWAGLIVKHSSNGALSIFLILIAIWDLVVSDAMHFHRENYLGALIDTFWRNLNLALVGSNDSLADS